MIVAAVAGCVAPELALGEERALVLDGDADQHHATAALGPDGQALVVFRADDRVSAVSWRPDDAPEAPWRPFETTTHHPQVARGPEGFLLVAQRGDGGLVTRALTWDGTAAADPVPLGAGRAVQPDLALGPEGGTVVAGGERGLRRWLFDPGFSSFEELEVLEGELGPGGTPTVRLGDAGLVLVWAERGDGRSTVRRRELGPTGDAPGPVVELAAWPGDDDGRPVLAIGRSGEATAWRRDGEAWLSCGGPELALHADGPAGRPSVAAVGDTVFVAWELKPGEAWTVVLQPFSLATGEALTAPVTVAADTGAPSRPFVTAEDDGDAVRGLVTWEQAEAGRRRIRARPFTW